MIKEFLRNYIYSKIYIYSYCKECDEKSYKCDFLFYLYYQKLRFFNSNGMEHMKLVYKSETWNRLQTTIYIGLMWYVNGGIHFQCWHDIRQMLQAKQLIKIPQFCANNTTVFNRNNISRKKLFFTCTHAHTHTHIYTLICIYLQIFIEGCIYYTYSFSSVVFKLFNNILIIIFFWSDYVQLWKIQIT